MLALAHCDKFKRVKYHITYVYCPGNFLNLKLCLEYWECRNTEVLLEPTPDQKGGRVMDTWEICLLFTSIVLFRQGECLFQSANNLTWTEAQAFCRRNQSSLIPGTEGHLPYPHWTGLYRRLSDWIHVLGCYDNQSVDGLGVLSTHALDRGSVGLCQERCGSQGRFALKNTTCLCLSSAPQTNSLPPSRCDWSCNPDDESHVNDCGGSDTYNVYKATPRHVQQSEITVNCVVLGCYEQWSQIHTDNCTEDLGRICQSESKTNKSLAPDEEDFKSWAETQSECKAEDSYLYGNISLSEDSGKLCRRLYDIRSNTPETWLGVARQVFLTKDRGEENVVIIECQICWGEKNCVLVKGCDSTAQTAYAVCGDATDLLPTTTEPTTTTTTETHTTSTTEITTSETTTIMETPTTTKETQTTSSIETSTTSTTEFPTTTETQSTSTTLIPTTSTTEIPTTSTTEIPTTSTTEIPTTSTTEIPTTSTTDIPTTSETEIPTSYTTEIPTTSTTAIPTTSTTEIPTTSTTEIPTTSTTEIPTTSTTEIPTTSTTETPTTFTTEIPTTSTTEIPTTSTTLIPTTSTTELPATTTEMQTTSSTEILTTEAQTLSTTAISTTTELKLTSTTETLTKATTTQETKTEISTSSENPLTQSTQNFTNTSSMTSSTGLPTTKEFSTTTENPAITTEIPTSSTTVSQTTRTTTVPLSNGKSSSAKQSESESKAEKAIAVTASLTIVGLILVILGIIWKRRGKLLSNLRRNKDKDATEGTYKHYSSIYDEVILPGEFQKENMYEMEEINDHNSITSEQLSNGGYTEREGLYENGVPPSKTASLTQPVPNDTVTSSRDKYQNMENINTKQTQESPPYITVIKVPKSQTGYLDNQKQYTSPPDRALNNVEKHKSVIQVGSDALKARDYSSPLPV